MSMFVGVSQHVEFIFEVRFAPRPQQMGYPGGMHMSRCMSRCHGRSPFGRTSPLRPPYLLVVRDIEVPKGQKNLDTRFSIPKTIPISVTSIWVGCFVSLRRTANKNWCPLEFFIPWVDFA